MSFADRKIDRVGALVERLLADPGFRAEFRADPRGVCRANGLESLADELGADGNAMHTLELRESRSSLAGVVMAVVAEGLGVVELRSMLGAHGLHGRAHEVASRALRGNGLNAPRHAGVAVSKIAVSVPHAAQTGAPARVAAAPAGPSATASAQSPSGAPPEHPVSPSSSPAASPSPAGAVALASASPSTSAPSAGASVGELLASPRLGLSPAVRSVFVQGGVDPRLVSVLAGVVVNHSVVVGGFESVGGPVHAQGLDIVAVDGEPVGPGNVGARDLVTEVAALDPGLRPSEIGSPWAIRARGFFTDVLHQDRLHFGFVSAGDYTPPGTATPAVNSGGVALAGPVPPQPINGLPVVSEPPPAAPVAQAGGVGGLASVPAGPAANVDPAGYVSPLPRDANIGRTDMGVDVDLRPGEPIVAPGNSRVLGIMQNWYAGQPYVGLQFLDGPLKGRNYYIAEQIDPAVTSGQIVARGQPIAHYAASGTGIEMGWAGPNWQQTLAQAEGNTGDASHNDAPAGISFRNFLRTFGF